MDFDKALETLTNSAATGEFHEIVKFANGRGVSIIRNSGSYGQQAGLFEVAVLNAAGDLDYSTPVTDDVIGWQSVTDVLDVMKAVAALPSEAEELEASSTPELEASKPVRFEVAFTGEVTDEAHASEGMARESGWINSRWSMRVLHAEKEDVRVYVFDTLEEAEEKIRETIGDTETDGGGSYYATESRDDYETGDNWSYAAHITEV